MKLLGNIVLYALILVLGLVAALSLATLLPIPGQIAVKIVQSGSMEPAIHTGSIVIIQPQETYAVGEVVTFGEDDSTHTPTTHRITSLREENGVTYFTTKGDANEEADTAEAPEASVIGRVLFSVPFVGYLITFAKQPLGFVVLIAIPAGLIILNELLNIIKEFKGPGNGGGNKTRREPHKMPEPVRKVRSSTQESRVRYARGSGMDDVFRARLFHRLQVHSASPVQARAHPLVVPFTLLVIVSVSVAGFAIKGTSAYYKDIEKSIANVLSAGVLDFTVDADAPRAIALTVGEGAGAGTSVIPFVASPGGSLPFAYTVFSEETGGTHSFCEGLQVEGSAPPFAYSGPLLALATGTTTDKSPWNLALYLADGAVVTEGDTCRFDLVYQGVQNGTDFDSEYHDEERLSFLITYHGGLTPLQKIIAPLEEVLGDKTEEPAEENLPGEGSPIEDALEEPPPEDPVPEEVPPAEPVSEEIPAEELLPSE
jgi:signal peptidase I